eukprot:m.11855 g.11855  ORF g.11855 m.11855 type:complete len:243 (+) comp23645_c0_seq4:2490-3218(+)
MLLVPVLLSFLAVFVHGNDVTCDKRSSCACKMSNGHGTIDLSTLSSFDEDRASFVTIDGRFQYNPCTPFTDGNCLASDDVAVCQGDDGGISCGVQSNVTFKYDPGTDIVTMVIQGGDANRLSNIELICNETLSIANSSFAFTMESPALHYNFQLTSKCSCPGGCRGGGGGISPGSILLIIFVVLLVVYIVAGVLFMKFKLGATGKEMVPNNGFWFGLPGLIKAGILFVFSCDQKGTAAYQNL